MQSYLILIYVKTFKYVDLFAALTRIQKYILLPFSTKENTICLYIQHGCLSMTIEITKRCMFKDY